MAKNSNTRRATASSSSASAGSAAQSRSRSSVSGTRCSASTRTPSSCSAGPTELTHVVQADATDSDALRQLGVARVRPRRGRHRHRHRGQRAHRARAHELGVPEIWAKAITAKHGQILERRRRHHVVYPEAAMGERVAHLVTGKMIDFIEFDDGFAIAKTRARREAIGKTLAESALRTKYGITVVGVKRPGERLHLCPPGDDGGTRRPADRLRPHRPGRDVRGADVATARHQ